MRKKIWALITAAAMLMSCMSAFAENTKHERVYVVTKTDGSVVSLTDNIRLENKDQSDEILDQSLLTSIQNLSGDETFTQDGESLTWHANGKDITYQGTSDKEPAVVPVVTFTLDGQEITADALKEKTGDVKLTVQYQNNQQLPALAVSILPLPSEGITDLEMENATVLSEAGMQVLVGWALPGVDKELELPTEFSASFHADHADLSWMMTLTTSDPIDTVCQEIDDRMDLDVHLELDEATEILNALQKGETIPETTGKTKEIAPKINELNSGLTELNDGAVELSDGAQTLSDGAGELLDGTKTLVEGIDTLANGSKDLRDGAKDLDDGAQKLSDGAKDLQDGAQKLDEGIGTLQAGAKNLSDGATQLDTGIGTVKDGTTNLVDGAGQLDTGAQQLLDGADSLKSGATQVDEGAASLADALSQIATGASQLKSGAKDLSDGAQSLSDGAASAQQGAQSLETGLETIIANNDALNAGATALFEAVLATANSQLAASGLSDSGITIPELTSENYTEVLNAVLTQLDPDALKANAYAQVEAVVRQQVEANMDQVRAGVEAAVQAKLLDAVLQAVGKNLTAEQYMAAVSAGQVTEETSNTVNAALSAQMATDEVQAQIEAAVNEQVEQLVAQNTEDYMSTDETMAAQLSAAQAAYESLSGLKDQLDQVAGFVSGLKTYTEGVSQAASGASALTQGLNQLAEGATALSTGSATLYEGTTSLATGSTKASLGAKTLNAGTKALASGAETLYDGVVTLKDGSAALYEGAQTLDDGVATLKNGSSSLAEGANTLYEGTVTLKDGSSTLYEGTGTLYTGTQDLKDGTGKLYDGTVTLYDGTLELQEGAGKLLDGTQELYDGSVTLADGAKTLQSDGTEKLMNTLLDAEKDAAEKLLPYVEDDLRKAVRIFENTRDEAKNAGYDLRPEDMKTITVYIIRTDLQ